MSIERRKISSRIPKISVTFDPKRNMATRVYLRTSVDAFNLCLRLWNLDTIDLFEEFKVIFLDRRNGVIGYRNLGRGTTVGVAVNTKLTFALALACNASKIILCHNHPSGRVNPSPEDNRCTGQISKAARLLDLQLNDHLIITRTDYYSYAHEGLLF